MVPKDGYKTGLTAYRGDLDVSSIIVHDGLDIFNLLR